MSEWRSEYTQIEWLQMGMFLIGMPIAALVGALIGLFGKWNQGRVVTAAIVGLASAAFVSVALFLTFLLVYWQLGAEQQSLMGQFFDSYLGQRIAILATIATATISLLAAIGLRTRKNERGSASSFSMSQLLLLQLFAFIALGCWTGMRFFAIDCGSELERAQRLWRQREWGVQAGEMGKPTYLVRQFPAQRIDMQKEAEYLREGLRASWLKQLRLSELPSPDDVPLNELKDAKNLELLMLGLAGTADFRQSEIDAIGNVPSLRRIYLESSGKIDADLLPLAKLPQLGRLSLRSCTVAPAAFSQLATSDSLRIVDIYLAGASSSAPIEWPRNLEELTIHQSIPRQRWSLKHIDSVQSLKTLRVEMQSLSSTEMGAISRIAGLRSLALVTACSEKDVKNLLELKQLESLRINEGGLRRSESYKQTLEQLALLPAMRSLACDCEVLVEAAEGSGIPLPSIEELESRQKRYSNRINARRQEMGLNPIDISFTNIGWPFTLKGSAAEGDTKDESMGSKEDQ
jgi:hypothetical protein